MVITELRRKRFISCCSHEYSRMQTNYSKSLHIKNSCCLLSFVILLTLALKRTFDLLMHIMIFMNIFLESKPELGHDENSYNQCIHDTKSHLNTCIWNPNLSGPQTCLKLLGANRAYLLLVDDQCTIKQSRTKQQNRFIFTKKLWNILWK